jgi:hypothetical protein
MTHDERIEAMARAIWNAESVRAASRDRCIDWLDVSERHRSDYIFLATAALAAAGVEEMIREAAEKAWDVGGMSEPMVLRQIVREVMGKGLDK